MYRDMTSMEKASLIETANTELEIEAEKITHEDNSKTHKKDPVGKLKKKYRDERKFIYGIGMTLFGVILIMALVIIFGEKSSLYTPFGFGVYFLGLTLVVNSWFSQKEDFITLNLKIEELSKKIDDLKK